MANGLRPILAVLAVVVPLVLVGIAHHFSFGHGPTVQRLSVVEQHNRDIDRRLTRIENSQREFARDLKAGLKEIRDEFRNGR